MTKIHPNAPPRLVKLLRNSGSFHKLADELEVNVAIVHGLVTKGKEPTDRTEHGREIRKRLFLPRYRRRKPRKERTPQPEHRRWWSKIGPDGRELIIKQMHDLNKDRIK